MGSSDYCQCPKKSDRAEDRVEAHALGRSKGGLSTKIHAATDALGNPVRFLLTGGERNDITQIEGLLDGLQARHVLADKGYDGQRAMGAIAARDRKGDVLGKESVSTCSCRRPP